MAPPRSVTPPDAVILDLIRQSRADGRRPTVRLLAEGVGLRTAGGMYRHLQRMRREGLVIWDEGRGSRDIDLRVVEPSVSPPETPGPPRR